MSESDPRWFLFAKVPLGKIKGEKFAELAGGERWAPRGFTITAWRDEDLEVEIDVAIKGGMPEPFAIRFSTRPGRRSWRPLTGADLRRIPLRRIVTHMTARLALRLTADGHLRPIAQSPLEMQPDYIREEPAEGVELLEGDLQYEPYDLDEDATFTQEVRAFEKRLATEPKRRSRRRRIDDAFLKKVAKVYRDSPGKPRQAVANEFTVSPSAASSYIAKARARGFLQPTAPGKKGEQAP